MIGVAFPLKKGSEGYWETAEDSKLILNDISCLLYTIPGEIPMYPNLGDPLFQFLFEQNSDVLAMLAEDLSEETIKRYEDRVEVIEIKAENRGNTLYVKYKLREKQSGKEMYGGISYELYR